VVDLVLDCSDVRKRLVLDMMYNREVAATYADLEKVPPHLVAEIIHGVLERYSRRRIVIASEAKQSRTTTPRALTPPSGLLRRCAPRNDGMVVRHWRLPVCLLADAVVNVTP
jgi:hypothetical protein